MRCQSADGHDSDIPTSSVNARTPIISTFGLSKQFGSQFSLAPLTLDLFPGEIVGLVGPNGAGKTTILNLLTGVLPASGGSVSVCGFDVGANPIEVKRRIGIAPDSDAVFESLTGFEFLEVIAGLYAVPVRQARERIKRMADLFDLEDRVLRERLLGAYSKGMRRKVIIASALLHNPSVVLLDEPLDGLDPNATVAFKTLIRSLADDGRTIVYSSHLLDVVERMCDRVLIIDRGNLVMDGRPADLLSASKNATLERLFTQITGGDDVREKAANVARSLSEREAASPND